MEDDDTELRNPFPSPPSHYVRYTTHNLRLLDLLLERSEGNPDSDQAETLADQSDVPEWSLRLLQKPRIDWILDEPDAHYDVFGDRWFVKDHVPSLGELGGTQLYPSGSEDRRPALVSILHSMLATYSLLTSSLLAPPSTGASTEPPEWQRHVEWITTLAQNIIAAANDLRPVQARRNLERMMTRQLEIRRQETTSLHAKCAELEARLLGLKEIAQGVATGKSESSQEQPSKSRGNVPDVFVEAGVDTNDVIRWAEQVV